MSYVRSLVSIVVLGVLLSSCEGTGTGRQLFGTPSNNIIASMKITFPIAPNRASGTEQFIAMYVNAYDRWGNLITVPYSSGITVTSSSTCEVGFSFYQASPAPSASPPPFEASLSFNSPQTIGVGFNPGCGPNPVKITASAPSVPNASVSF
jgi:hypothetical protein